MDLLVLVESYQAVSVLAGSFLLREAAIIPAAAFSAGSEWSVARVFVLSIIGMTANDIVWFLVIHRLPKPIFRWLLRKVDVPLWHGRTRRSLFAMLMASNLFSGARIAALAYLDVSRTGFTRLLGPLVVTNILWGAFIVSAGWLAGRGIVNVLPAYRQAALALLVVSVIVLALNIVWPRHRYRARA